MNTNLILATSQPFGNVQCDFWSDKENGNDIWMTRDQIGTALEYTPDPSHSIAVIHQRHKDRLNKFSWVHSLSTPSGTQDCTVYSARGVFEICRWSRQAKADEFMDWVWEIVDGLRTGKYKLSQNNSNIPYDTMIANLNQNQTILMQELSKTTQLAKDNTENLLALAYEVDDVRKNVKNVSYKSDAYDTFILSKGLLSLNRVAKSLNIGRNQMMAILRYKEILFKDGNDNIPYEKFIKAGYFVVDNNTGRDGKIHSATRVTAKGVTFIFDIMKQLN